MTAIGDTIAAVLVTPAETFVELLDRVRAVCPEAEVSEIDASARPFERGEPGAYRYSIDAEESISRGQR